MAMIWWYIYIFGALFTATRVSGRATKRDGWAVAIEVAASLLWPLWWPLAGYIWYRIVNGRS